jgi:aspartyl/asparaginyl-tRNA synthetase
MPSPETNILDRAESEVEQIFERMRRHCERALAILRDINLDELSPENREQVHRQIHALREFVRILSPDFEKKLMVEAAKLGRDLSREEALRLLYGLDEF